MRSRKVFLSSILLIIGLFGYSQEDVLSQLKEKSDKFNVHINFHGSYDNDFAKGMSPQARFVGKTLRIDFSGNLTDRIFYRIRHKLNDSNMATSLDGLSDATNFMFAGFKISPKWTFMFGKMPQAWGGYEYGLNPMYVYQYSDYSSHLEIFITGAAIAYKVNDNHEFTFNVSDVRNARINERYDLSLSNDVKAANRPLSYMGKWTGNMLDGKLQTIWGVGMMNEADGFWNKSVLLGTKLNLNKFQMYLDYAMDSDQLDRLGYVATTIAGGPKQGLRDTRLRDVTYNTLILNAQYRVSKEWNIFGQVDYETARIKETDLIKDLKRDSKMFQLGVEYYPFESQDLRFYAVGMGQEVKFKEGIGDNKWGKFAIGMMYRIKAF